MPVEMAPPTYFGNLPAIQPPQSENLLQTAQQANALKMFPLQQQAAQQQIQGQQLSIQQQKMEMASQQGLMKAYLAAGGDPDKAAQLAPQYGVLPKDIIGWRISLMNMAKTHAETDKATTDAATAKMDILHSAYQPAFDETDPAKQADLVKQANQSLLARYPNTISQGDLLNYTGPQDLIHAKAAYTTTKWMETQGAELRGQAANQQATTASNKENAELPGQQAASEMGVRKSTAQLLAGVQDPASYDQARDAYIAKGGNAAIFPPSRMAFDASGKMIPAQQSAINRAAMTPEQRTQADQAAANAAQPKTEAELAAVSADPAKTQEQRDAANQALKRLDASRVAARPVVNVTNAAPVGDPITAATPHGEAYLATLPGGRGGVVRGIVQGQVAAPSGFMLKDPYWKGVMESVMQADPAWSQTRAQTRKDFAPGGKDSGNVGALNTAVVHLDALGDLARAMDNGPIQPGNEILNRVSTMFGGAAPTNYEGLRQAVAGEMDGALHGTYTIPGRDAIAATMPAKGTPGQMAGIVETNLHTLGQKLATQQQRYSQQIPDDKVWSPILPAARGVFQKHGFDPTAPAQPNPGGGGQQTAPPKFNVGDSVMYQGKAHKVTGVDPQTGKLTLAP